MKFYNTLIIIFKNKYIIKTNFKLFCQILPDFTLLIIHRSLPVANNDFLKLLFIKLVQDVKRAQDVLTLSF